MKSVFLFCAMVSIQLLSQAQVNNTMFGLYQTINPPSFQLASLDPLTGQITTISSTTLSSVVNATGSSLNPYNQTYSYQDEDSWLSIDLQTGAVVSDVNVTLPNVNGYFNNFRFNTADSIMYGLFSQVFVDSITGSISSDLRLATCDLSSGSVNLISPTSIADSYTMSGNTIDPYLMVYYFESEGKIVGIDLYNGQIYSQPYISIPNGGSSFDNIAYSCADTSIYGLIMQNGVHSLGKIDPNSGVVTALPTLLSFDNYVMNSGGTIDPINQLYYFQTMDSLGQIYMVGLSLTDGSIVSQSNISLNGNYFIMYRIQSDCYDASPTRSNPMNDLSENESLHFDLHPNPVQNVLSLNADCQMYNIEIINPFGTVVQHIQLSDKQVELDTDHLSKGVYYIRISGKQSSSTKRFVKI